MEPFIRILVEDIMAFAYGDDEDIDPDFAVAQLERIAQSVAAAGEDSVSIFRQTVKLMANEARAKGDEEEAGRLDAMPAHLSLD